MRLAYVCADARPACTDEVCAQLQLRETALAFARLGADVDCFTTRPELLSPCLPGLRIHALPLPRGEGPEREAAAVAGNAALGARLRESGELDLIYERFSVWSFTAMETAARLGIPGVLEVGSPLIEEQAAHHGLYDVGSAWSAAMRAWRAATTIVARSRSVRETLDRFDATRGKVTEALDGPGVPAWWPLATPAAALPPRLPLGRTRHGEPPRRSNRWLS